MAQNRQKNLVERLADVGEEAMQRISNAPGGDRVVGALNTMRDRVDDLQKRMRGLEQLEKRLASVERRLDKLEGKGTTPRKAQSTRKPASSS
jgi:TolA-binding protein